MISSTGSRPLPVYKRWKACPDVLCRRRCRGAGALPTGPAATPAEAIKLSDGRRTGARSCTPSGHEGDRSKQVAEHLRSKSVPILLVTGYERNSLDPCFAAGSTQYMTGLPYSITDGWQQYHEDKLREAVPTRARNLMRAARWDR